MNKSTNLLPLLRVNKVQSNPTLGSSSPLVSIAPHYGMFQCHSALAGSAQDCGHASPRLSRAVLKQKKKKKPGSETSTWPDSQDKQGRKVGYLQSAQHTSTGKEPCSCRLHTPSPAAPLAPRQNSPGATHKHCNQFTSIRFKAFIWVSRDHNIWSDIKVSFHAKCYLMLSKSYLVMKPVLADNTLNHLIIDLYGDQNMMANLEISIQGFK